MKYNATVHKKNVLLDVINNEAIEFFDDSLIEELDEMIQSYATEQKVLEIHREYNEIQEDQGNPEIERLRDWDNENTTTFQKIGLQKYFDDYMENVIKSCEEEIADVHAAIFKIGKTDDLDLNTDKMALYRRLAELTIIRNSLKKY